ncbi:MAG: helix-turn-helix domain-containing protein [Pseudonocardiaceae bacterium]
MSEVRAEPGLIGQRVRRVRESQGKSLDVIGGLAGISGPYLSQLERGIRPLDRFSLILKIANALGVPVTDLTSLPIPTPGNGKTDSAVEAVRRALTAVELDRPAGLIVPVEVLHDRVRAAQRTRYAADFRKVGELLPSLIRDLHTTLNDGRNVAELLDLAVLVHVDLTCMWLRDASAHADLRRKAANIARQLAHRRDEPTTLAVAAFGTAHTLLASGMPDLAQDELNSVSLPTGSAPGLAGALLQQQGYAATMVDDLGNAAAAMAEASDLAAVVGEIGLSPLGFAFGPLQIGIQGMNLHLEAGDAAAAAALGRTLEPRAHPYATRQAAYHVNMGRALAKLRGAQDRALAAICIVEELMPVRVRRNLYVRETIAELIQRSRRNAISRELRELAKRSGLDLLNSFG